MRCSASGPDGIPAIFFKRLAYWLANPLAIIYEQSLYQRKIPDSWREARVIPLYKGKGEKNKPSSYRLISLTLVACKALERIIADKIQDYLNKHSLINTKQHGFTCMRSKVSNRMQCDWIISKYLNSRTPYDIMLLDFSKAFDKVPHAILLSKLQKVGLGGSLDDWLADFLSCRTH